MDTQEARLRIFEAICKNPEASGVTLDDINAFADVVLYNN